MPTDNDESIAAAKDVMRRHIEALNSRNESALVATLHFPHYRLTQGRLQTWETPDGYFAGFLARTNEGWKRSEWIRLDVITAGPEKVHLDVEFNRYGDGDVVLGTYRSLWVIAKLNERWAAQLRSSFAN